MKRVRFLTPTTENLSTMNDSNCHSPRPFIQRNLDNITPELPCVFEQNVLYSPDPVKRFEYSDASPYPTVNKTEVISKTDTGNQWSPSIDLELSILDSSNQQPRKPVYFTPVVNISDQGNICGIQNKKIHLTPEPSVNVLSPIENANVTPTNVTPHNVLHKDDNFFITRGGLSRFQLQDTVQVQMNKMSLGKENSSHMPPYAMNKAPIPSNTSESCDLDSSCSCHHCCKVKTHSKLTTSTPGMHYGEGLRENNHPNFIMQTPVQPSCNHCTCTHNRQISPHCPKESLSPKAPNAVDKKAWIVERYEQAKNQCTDVEKQMNVSKEKREPTVGDLLKIIKLQNEQLQLLQEKVDKLISTRSSAPQMPVQNFVTEHVAMETIDRDQHKISIGVMTSLEMVRTSTIINKELVKQSYNNAQVQCNRSEISIKEVVKQPVNLNFLDGILPVGKTSMDTSMQESPNQQHMSNYNDEKTLNEQSLYNVQVDNATTPLMSPEQSLYLDVRDYSGSDSGSDQSNVGWTYYNKVMTHVNGMLQDSDMPSSASALYRNTRQQCVQMQIDKTNISVTKRVTFGDEPPTIQQYLPSSNDTSLRMNQLAAKYLKTPAPTAPGQPRQGEMSFATKNYMERHKIIQGQSASSKRAPQGEIPRFLDITTLKQQPKLL